MVSFEANEFFFLLSVVATVPEGAEYMYGGWYPNNYPNNYPTPPYWYYPPQTPEEQQQFWEHYNAMCAYMAQMNAAAYRYSPYPMYPYGQTHGSDSEEYSGYSSNDEMSYYNRMFQKQGQPPEQMANGSPICYQNGSIDPSLQYDHKPLPEVKETREEEEESGSDTELEEENEIKAITKESPTAEVEVHSDSSESESSQSDETESSEEEEEEDEEVEEESLKEETDFPHQLSIIYEDSEHSDAESFRKPINDDYESEEESSSSTIGNCDESNSETTTVKVRLPLKLTFSRSVNDEDVTTVTVGNSELEQSMIEEQNNCNNSIIIHEDNNDDSDPDVSVTISLKKNNSTKNCKTESSSMTLNTIENELKERSESPVDFWKEIIPTNDALKKNSLTETQISINSQFSEDDIKFDNWEDDSSTASIRTVRKGEASDNCSGSEMEAFGTADELDDNQNDSSSPDQNQDDNEFNSAESSDEDNESGSDSSSHTEDESKDSSLNEDIIKNGTDGIEKIGRVNGEETKIQEESEEDDSGVTSDLSRHISETDTDPECSSELGKMSRCQRAATHSRLFKLLQEECGQEEEVSDNTNSISVRKERLKLPLNSNSSSDPDSLSSSSGVNSPSSPTVNTRLVKELVQSLLSRKKGRHFRKLPIEKLHAAALRILQEDMDPYDTGSTSDEGNLLLSPSTNTLNRTSQVNNNTANEIPHPEIYGGNYYDYCNYYNTWANAAAAGYPMDHMMEQEMCYDIVPSKAFRVLRERVHSDGFDPSSMKGVLAKCPRVLSSKTINLDLICDRNPILSDSESLPASPFTGT
jgi:hypothetical protein